MKVFRIVEIRRKRIESQTQSPETEDSQPKNAKSKRGKKLLMKSH